MVQSAANSTSHYDIEQTVLERYQAGAKAVQPSLCCPTQYEADYLKILPQEIIEKDYGCGDPSRHVRAIDGIAFRSLTVRAVKGKEECCKC